MRRIIVLTALLVLVPLVGMARLALSTERRVVLVAAASTELVTISLEDLRRLYLGASLRQGSNTIRPLRNVSDSVLYEVFLQKVVFMSARTYEHQVLSRVFRFGGNRPEEFRDIRRLVEALHAEPGAVTYMWEDTAKHLPGIQVVTQLWQGQTN